MFFVARPPRSCFFQEETQRLWRSEDIEASEWKPLNGGGQAELGSHRWRKKAASLGKGRRLFFAAAILT